MASECMKSWLSNYELLKNYYKEYGNIDNKKEVEEIIVKKLWR